MKSIGITRWGSDWSSLGKFHICCPHNSTGVLPPVIWGVEWSSDINAQDTIYSLDEEYHLFYDKGECLSEEEEDKWDNIIYGE